MKKILLFAFTFLLIFTNSLHAEEQAKALAKKQAKELIEAIYKNNYEAVKKLLNEGVSPKSYDKFAPSPLISASLRGHLNIVKLLLDKGASPDSLNNHNTSALMGASTRGHIDVVKTLLAQDASLDLQNKDGDTALLHAAKYKHLNVVKELLAHGASPDIQNNGGDTALILAVTRNVDMVKALLEKKASLDLQNKDGNTALMDAGGMIYGGGLDLEELDTVVKLLLENGASPDIHDKYYKRTVLMDASHNNRAETVKILLEHGASLDIKDKDGNTALSLALKYEPKTPTQKTNHTKIIKLLSEKGAGASDSEKSQIDGQLNAQENLLKAINEKNLKGVQDAVGYGANLSLADNRGRTPLMNASQFGNLEIVKFLVQKGSKVNETSKLGGLPIVSAAMGGNIDIIKFFMEKGVSINASEKYGYTPLIGAAHNKQGEAIKFLMENGADPDRRFRGGGKAIDLLTGHDDLIRLIDPTYVPVDKNVQQATLALSNAIRQGDVDAVKAAVKNPLVDYTKEDHNGFDLATLASIGGNKEITVLVENAQKASQQKEEAVQKETVKTETVKEDVKTTEATAKEESTPKEEAKTTDNKTSTQEQAQKEEVQAEKAQDPRLLAPETKKPGVGIILASDKDVIGLNAFAEDKKKDSHLQALLQNASPLIAVKVESIGGVAASWKTKDVKTSALFLMLVSQNGKVLNEKDASFEIDVTNPTVIDFILQDNGAIADTKSRLRATLFYKDGSRNYVIFDKSK